MEYKNPKPTVDIVILLDKPSILSANIVLIKRKNPPLGYALPGGYVNEGESFEDAAIREAKEETGLDVELVEQFHTYSDPKRDPRQHNVSTVYLATAKGSPKAGDDAADIFIWGEGDRPEMAFDHDKILDDVIEYAYYGTRPRLTRRR